LVMLKKDFSFRTLEIPGAILILIATAGFAVRAHVLPVWPDAMAALPAGIEHANIAAIWRAEQAATGLFARDTIWALLRCASLAGCGLLVYAAVLGAKSFEAQNAGLAGTLDGSKTELAKDGLRGFQLG
jgi:hypothetical protein